MVSQAARGAGATQSFADQWNKQLVPSALNTPLQHESNTDTFEYKPLDGLDDGTVSDPDWAFSAKMSGPLTDDSPVEGGIRQFGKNAAKIAQAAAKVKRLVRNATLMSPYG